MNNTDVYLIGGDSPSLLSHPYNVQRSCLLLNIETAKISMKEPMRCARAFDHAVACVKNYLFVVGGWKNKCDEVVKDVERYDVVREQWVGVAEWDEFGAGVALVVVGSRYLFGFGGVGMEDEVNGDPDEFPTEGVVKKFDSLKGEAGWKTIKLKRPLKTPGNSYGLLLINNSTVLVFGGST